MVEAFQTFLFVEQKLSLRRDRGREEEETIRESEEGIKRNLINSKIKHKREKESEEKFPFSFNSFIAEISFENFHHFRVSEREN